MDDNNSVGNIQIREAEIFAHFRKKVFFYYDIK